MPTTIHTLALLVAAFTAPAAGFTAPCRLPQRAATARPLAAAPLASRVAAPAVMQTTVVPEDYKVAAGFIAVGVVVLVAPWLIGGFSLVLGLFLVFQTLRIRFVFDDDSFEVKTKELDQLFGGSDSLTNTGENFAVGGENRWPYSSFVNYDFFPTENFPILVYFKETATPADKWDVGPGQWANGADALAKGAVKGQVHFFPCIAKADVLKEQFVAKGLRQALRARRHVDVIVNEPELM